MLTLFTRKHKRVCNDCVITVYKRNMAQRITVGVRLPEEYLQEIDAICEATGKNRSDVLLEAVTIYLGKTPADAVQSTLEQLQQRLESLEKKLPVA